jgi:hypothetical protein
MGISKRNLSVIGALESRDKSNIQVCKDVFSVRLLSRCISISQDKALVFKKHERLLSFIDSWWVINHHVACTHVWRLTLDAFIEFLKEAAKHMRRIKGERLSMLRLLRLGLVDESIRTSYSLFRELLNALNIFLHHSSIELFIF